MKTLKKLFSVSAIVALLGTLAPMYAFGATYTDELEDAYAYARANGVTTKNTIDEADMYGSLTRIAMAKMIANYATSVLGLEADTSRNCTFSDVSTTLDAEYGNGVTNACQLGLMGIDDNGNVKATFDPKGTVTRAQFATALSRAISQAEDGEAIANGNPYYRTHIAYLNGKGIVKSEAEYDVNSVEKRGYVMLMMMRADESYKPGCTPEQIVACTFEDDTAACLAACSGNEEPEEEVVNPGYITVRRDGSTSTVTAPRNAVNKKVGSVKLTAGENDSTVTALTVKVNGVSRSNAVVVNVMKDGVKIGTARAVSTSSKSATIRLNSNLVVKAGKSEVLDIVATLSGANGGDEYSFSVSDVTVVNGESAGLPVSLGGLKTNNYEVKTLDSITWNATTPLKAGKSQEQIATVSFTPSVDSTLKGFTVTRTGDVDFPDALTNVKLYNNDVAIATATVTNDKFAFDGLNLESVDGNSITLTIKADTTYIGSAKTIYTYIDENDVTMVEKESEEEMPTIHTPSAPIAFDGADFTITKMTSGNETVAPGSSNVVLFDAKITSTTEFDVTEYEVSFDTALTTGVFSKVTLYVNGVDYPMVDSEAVYAAGGKTLELTKDVDNFTVSANQPARIKVTANVRNTEAASGVYQGTLKIKKMKNPEDSASAAFTVTKSKAGDKVTISNGKYTTTKPTSMPTNKTIVAGEDEDVLYFNLKASAEDLLLKEVVVESAKLFTGFATSVSLMQGETLVKEINDEEKLASGTIVFDGLNTRLNKDTSVPFTVRIAVVDDEVETLGASVNVNLTSTKAVRANNTNVSFTGTSLAGNTYTISSTNPDVDYTEKDGVYTTMEITNKSSYDLKLETVKVSITRNDLDAKWTGTLAFTESKGGDNLLPGATPAVVATWTTGSAATCSGDNTITNSGACSASGYTWVPEVDDKCEIDGVLDSSITTQAACIAKNQAATNPNYTIPGTLTLPMPADTFIEANNGSLIRVFELLSDEYNITANDYTVKVTELGFYFADKDDHSKLSTGGMITENYTKTK